MKIELLGIPGTGKSYYVNEELKEHNEIMLPLNKYIYNKSRLIQNFKKLILLFRILICHPHKFLKVLYIFKSFKFKSLKQQIKLFLYTLNTIEIIEIISSKKDDSKVYFLDEGICQVLWGLCYNLNYLKKDEIEKIIIQFEEYILEEIIFFNVDKLIIQNRLLARVGKGGSELQHDILTDLESLDKAEIIALNMYSILKERKYNIKIKEQ